MIFLVFINYIFSFRGQAKNLFYAWMPPPPGTSRFKFPKNKKKPEMQPNSLKIDDTNEIGESRECALHFAKSNFKPNLRTFSKLPEISSARKFPLSSAIPSTTVTEPKSPLSTFFVKFQRIRHLNVLVNKQGHHMIRNIKPKGQFMF